MRDGPVRAGLDEPIVVEACDILFEPVIGELQDLVEGTQRLERLPLVGGPHELRQKGEEPVACDVSHPGPPSGSILRATPKPVRSRTSICAGVTNPEASRRVGRAVTTSFRRVG